MGCRVKDPRKETILKSNIKNPSLSLISCASYLAPTVGTFLLDVDPVPKTFLMELVFALEHHAVIFHFLETYCTVLFLFLLLISQLDLFGQENEQETGADLRSEFLINVIPLEEGIGDTYQDKVGAGEKEDKLIKEDGLASAVPDQLEDKYQRDSPLEHQNGNQRHCLVIDDMFHRPVKERRADHAQGRKAQIDWDQNEDLNVGEQLQAEL